LGRRAEQLHGRRNLLGPATLIASLTLAAGASAGSGGVGGGGVQAPEPPKVADVQCLETCAGLRKATEGSRVELTGSHLREVGKVSFDGDAARIEVDPLSTGRHSVKAQVPVGAQTGRPKVDAPSGTDTSPEVLTIVAPDEMPEGGEFKLDQAQASPAKAFYDGIRDPKVDYVFEGEATDIRVQVIKRKSGNVIRSWVEEGQQPFVQNTARWDGRADDGKPGPNGKYRFDLGPVAGGAPETTDTAKFSYYGYKFPLRGPHTYGDGIGAGRGHQGQDIFAKCGTEIEAARGGTVQWKRYQSAAGYYLVIDGKATGRDFVYMHMKKKGRPNEGARVHTGERIGWESDTGNASGCHLHFEIWSAPGWYEGGNFTNPTDDLKAWDEYS
jgi:murein DD-endopeptidase MepM/ murein hydrolase activator NlpD